MRRARLKPVAWTARAGRGELTSWRSCCGWCGCRCEQSTKSELPCVDGFDGGGGMGVATQWIPRRSWRPRCSILPRAADGTGWRGGGGVDTDRGGDHPWLCK